MNKIKQEIRIGSMHILVSNSKYRDNSLQRAIKETLIFSISLFLLKLHQKQSKTLAKDQIFLNCPRLTDYIHTLILEQCQINSNNKANITHPWNQLLFLILAYSLFYFICCINKNNITHKKLTNKLNLQYHFPAGPFFSEPQKEFI